MSTRRLRVCLFLTFCCLGGATVGTAVASAAWAEDLSAAGASLRANNADNAAKILRSLADQGDPKAMHELGRLYEIGAPGFAANPRQAVTWYQRASDAGSAEAQNDLALLFAGGVGVNRDRSRALALWRLAAGSGLAAAQFNLGLALLQGDADEVREAQVWLQQADRAGVAQASPALTQWAAIGITPTAATAAALESPAITISPTVDVVTEELAGPSKLVQQARDEASDLRDPAAEDLGPKAGEEPQPRGVRTADSIQKVALAETQTPVETASISTFENPDPPTESAKAYRVWLGFARDVERAEKAAQQIVAANSALLADAPMHLEEAALITGGAYQRILFGDWPTRAEAESFCDALRQDGSARFCRIVVTGGPS